MEKTLFYGERDYGRAVRTLERLRKHLLRRFVIVGGISNRRLFPEWGERKRSKKFNDLDVVLLPMRPDSDIPPISTTVKDDFYVNHITENAGYFSMIDRKDFVGVDVFTATRNMETQEMELEGKTYLVLTPEERYLSMARDIYQTLSNERILDPKHVEFLDFLQPKIDQKKVSELWSAEEKIIKKSEKYPFISMEQYLDQIKKLIASNKEKIVEKVPGTQKRPYNSPRAEAFGIRIENEADFHASYEAKRKFWRE